MPSDENLIISELQVDETAIDHLRESSKWARFLGVTGMGISLLLALVGLFLPVFLNTMSGRAGTGDYLSQASMLGMGFLSFFYIIVAVVFFIISIFLFHFGAKMKKALQFTDQHLFNESLLNLKRHYRTAGIITIIYLSFLALSLLMGLLGVLFAR